MKRKEENALARGSSVYNPRGEFSEGRPEERVYSQTLDRCLLSPATPPPAQELIRPRPGTGRIILCFTHPKMFTLCPPMSAT